MAKIRKSTKGTNKGWECNFSSKNNKYRITLIDSVMNFYNNVDLLRTIDTPSIDEPKMFTGFCYRFLDRYNLKKSDMKFAEI